jgi:hypothetical protein
MPRPKKDPAQRKTVHLRVPVTSDQKGTIDAAMAAESREFAGWARDLLLEAARAILDRKGAPKKQRASKP